MRFELFDSIAPERSSRIASVTGLLRSPAIGTATAPIAHRVSVFVDVDPSVDPYTGATVAAIVESASASPEVSATTFMSTDPPLGTTSLSGTVITEGGVPVDQACVFVLSSPQFVFPAITDAAGAWSVTGLPDSYSFAVGVVPPFGGTFGPCAEAGPPPVPAPGELQPVFVGDVWIDLDDPLLTGGLGDPYTFAINAGATSFSASAAGLEACLTTAPGNQIPRPPCVVAAASTTTTSTTTSSTSTSSTVTTTQSTTSSSDPGTGVGAVEVTAATLPFTGADATSFAAMGIVAVLAGVALLLVVGSGSADVEEPR